MTKTYTEYIEETNSEKITLVHLHAKQYLFTFSVYSGSIYEKTTNYVVTAISQNGTPLTLVVDKDSVIINTFYFDILTNKLYVYTTDIGNDKFLVTYRMFFSNAPVSLSWNLDNGEEVYYDPRLTTTVPYSVKTDASAVGVALIGSGSIALNNTDKGLDAFGKLYFENQDVNVYSYNREILETSIKQIYAGVVNNKILTEYGINFKINNKLDFINNTVDLDLYPESDDISESVSNTYKSRIFGRVDGVQLQSVSALGENFILSGTITGSEASQTLTGTSTSFLSELSPDDELTLSDGQIIIIETIESDTSLTLADELTDDITDGTAIILPYIDTPAKNRTWQVSGKALRQTTATIMAIPFTNAVELDDVDDLEINDYIIFTDGQVRLINSISGNRINLSQSLIPLPDISDTITRSPIQQLYYKQKEVANSTYTITNNSTVGCKIVLDADMEKTHFTSRGVDTGNTYSINSGNRVLNSSGTNEILPELIKPRDYIKCGNSDWYEVLQVSESTVTVRTNFATTQTAQKLYVKNVHVVNDDSIISANCIGETDDNEPTGVWTKTASDFVKKLLIEQGLESILNTASFTSAKEDINFTVSVIIPKTPNSQTSPKLKKILNDVNKSVFTALVINSDMELAYYSVDGTIDYDNIITIGEHDNIKWKPKIENNTLYETIIGVYNQRQISRVSEDTSNSIISFINTLVSDLDISASFDFKLQLRSEAEAESMIQRKAMLSQTINTTIEIESDLRYSNLEWGEVVILDLDLSNSFGDIGSDKRLMMVTAIKNDGEKILTTFSDLNGLLVRRCIITANDCPDYTLATSDEKLLNSWITDDNGLQDSDEESYGRNIII